MRFKTCTRCYLELPLASFARDSHKKSGIKSICKACDRVKAREYYEANLEARREVYRARNAARYRNAPTHFRERGRELYRLHRDRALQVYGGACEACGTTQGRLEFDHVNGDGGEHRGREPMRDYVRRISAGQARLTDVDLQLLCVPCHRGKSGGETARRDYGDSRRRDRGPDGRFAPRAS